MLNKKTTSLKVPLINVPISFLALARTISHVFNIRIFKSVPDPDYIGQILETCQDTLCLAVSSMTCYQIRNGLNV